MSNCSNHRKDVHGETDMQHLAEEVGNLHYETLAAFLNHLQQKLQFDAEKDFKAGRIKLAAELRNAGLKIDGAWWHIYNAWEISSPFMKSENTKPH